MFLFQEGDKLITRYTTDHNFSYTVLECIKDPKPSKNIYILQNNESGVILRCPQTNIDSTCEVVQ